MLDEICIRRRAGRKFDPDSVLKSRWTILSSLSHCGSQTSDGCFNRGIKLIQENSTGRLCVLKMLPPDICSPGHAAHEIRILRDLKRYNGCGGHANVLRLLDADDGSKHPHDIPWTVTELCDRGTLAQLVKLYGDERLHLPEAFLWHVFEGLSEAVRFCHGQGVVHRDITLTNVFLQSSGRRHAYPRIQLGDFGCAVTRTDLAQFPFGSFFPGNPRFMPPEGCEAEPACDIYQIGLVLLCLYMCDLNPTECLADFLNGQDARGGKGSRELEILVKWCLASKGEERPSADVLVKKIRKLKVERQGGSLFEELMEMQKEVGFESDSTG
ncbi:hypothetical protein N0V90_010978 [Kalmusia sp. IMI 367209]|nr:hypothetical protein N0V90_010978 [Kalmusia sp. IMI 367209]